MADKLNTSESRSPTHVKRADADLKDALVLAQELSRGTDIPEIAGFELHCFGCKANLWWHGGRHGARQFSDALPTGSGKFALIAANVSDSVDGAGAAQTIRAYLRAVLQKTRSLSASLFEVLSLVRGDKQWSFLATLSVCILDCNSNELEFVSLGGAEICLFRVMEVGLQRLGNDTRLPLMQIDDSPWNITTERTKLDQGDICLILSQSVSEWVGEQQAGLHDCFRSVMGGSEKRFGQLLTLLHEVQQNAVSGTKACVAVRCRRPMPAAVSSGAAGGRTM